MESNKQLRLEEGTTAEGKKIFVFSFFPPYLKDPIACQNN